MRTTRKDRNLIKQACYLAGIGTPVFCDEIAALAFTPEGTPIVICLTDRKLPMKVRQKCAGRKIKLLEINESTEYVTAY